MASCAHLHLSRALVAALTWTLLAASSDGRASAAAAGAAGATCTNFNNGKWVRDTARRPAYNADTCKFMGVSNCLKQTNRPKDWLYWSWQPNGCPASGLRFDARGFLKLMRNRVFASVGESISVRGFLLSVVCHVSAVTTVKQLPKPNRFGDTEVYHVPSHNVTIVNFWAEFLVNINRSNEALARFGNTKPALQDTVVNLFQLSPNLSAYLGLIHVIVLQSAADWPGGRDLMRRYYTDGKWNAIKPAPTTYRAYEIGMNTVFNHFSNRFKAGKRFPVPYFLSAPPRLNGCQNATKMSTPAQVASLLKSNKASRSFLPVQQKVFQNRPPFRFLPITRLSMYRGDGFYSSGGYDGGRDCLHFCLPGVTDVWADAMYTVMKGDVLIQRAK